MKMKDFEDFGRISKDMKDRENFQRDEGCEMPVPEMCFSILQGMEAAAPHHGSASWKNDDDSWGWQTGRGSPHSRPDIEMIEMMQKIGFSNENTIITLETAWFHLIPTIYYRLCTVKSIHDSRPVPYS